MKLKTAGVETHPSPRRQLRDASPGRPTAHGGRRRIPGRVRVQMRPAGRTEEWLERLVAMDRDGEFTKCGWPRAVAGAAS